VFCCPIMKSLTLLAGACLIGYAGYEAGSLYVKYQDLDKPGCCPNSQGITPAVAPGTEKECCPTEEEGTDIIAKESCCKNGGRAALLTQAKKCEGDCCEDEATPVAVKVEANLDGWANVKGQILFGGDAIPKAEESKVTADQGHCLAKGALLDKVWDVNASNKGLAGVVVFINPERDEKLAIHPDLQGEPKPFVLDQPYCLFTPRIFAIRSNQALTAKNPDPVAHNVVVKGIKNDQNVQIPPSTEKQLKLVAEGNALAISCGSHPWMKGYGWCFDHPYFAVTDKDGNFEIKNVPAGSRKIVIWHETGYLAGYSKRDNKTLNLGAGATVDVGTVKAMPK
jgi:hypothetical protein